MTGSQGDRKVQSREMGVSGAGRGVGVTGGLGVSGAGHREWWERTQSRVGSEGEMLRPSRQPELPSPCALMELGKPQAARPQDRVMPLPWALWVPWTLSPVPSAPMASLGQCGHPWLSPGSLPGALSPSIVVRSASWVPQPRGAPYSPHPSLLFLSQEREFHSCLPPASLGPTCMQGPCLLYTVSSTQKRCQVPTRLG